MRIASNYMFDKSINNLQSRQEKLSSTQEQLTSGKRVNYASDDPTAAARAERALATIARTEANQRTLDASRNVMNIAETALGNGVDLLQSARETLMANGHGRLSACPPVRQGSPGSAGRRSGQGGCRAARRAGPKAAPSACPLRPASGRARPSHHAGAHHRRGFRRHGGSGRQRRCRPPPSAR